MALDRAPDCTTTAAAEIAGILSAAIMAGELSFITQTDLPDAVNARISAMVGSGSTLSDIKADMREGFRTACLMIEARARSSVRTPPQGLLSAAEVALALAEDCLDADPSSPAKPDDAFAVLATIRDTLRVGLRPTHEAETAPPPAGA